MLKFDSDSNSYEERTEKAVSHGDMEFHTRKQTAGFSSVIV